MIKRILLISLIMVISCKSVDNICLIKDTGITDVPLATTIETFPWNNGYKGQLDSIIIKGKRKKQLYRILSKLYNNNFDSTTIWIPQYAFILEYKNKKDTLFFDENFTEGYLIRNNIELIDTTNILKTFLFKEYEYFFKRDLLFYQRKYYPETLDY